MLFPKNVTVPVSNNNNIYSEILLCNMLCYTVAPRSGETAFQVSFITENYFYVYFTKRFSRCLKREALILRSTIRNPTHPTNDVNTVQLDYSVQFYISFFWL